MARLAQRVFKDVSEDADKHTRTGALFSSVTLKKESKDAYLIFHNLTRAPYAPFVHWGSKPHKIAPNKRKSLRWVSANGFVFAKFVNHPGYKGDPYMVRAVKSAPGQFDAIVASMQSEV